MVLAEERWTERQRRAGQTQRVARQSQWRWVVTRELAALEASVIWRIGHQRWGAENHAFNELTQHYHLTHCPRHEPVAIQAWLLIRVLGFNLFELGCTANCGARDGSRCRNWRGNWTAPWKGWRNCDPCGAGDLLAPVL